MSWGDLSLRSIILGGSCPGAIIWGQFSYVRIGRGAIVLGENCPVGIARGDCPRWQFSGDNCLGDNCSGGGGAIAQGGVVLFPK